MSLPNPDRSSVCGGSVQHVHPEDLEVKVDKACYAPLLCFAGGMTHDHHDQDLMFPHYPPFLSLSHPEAQQCYKRSSEDICNFSDHDNHARMP